MDLHFDSEPIAEDIFPFRKFSRSSGVLALLDLCAYRS
jgi:hypothetical protein